MPNKYELPCYNDDACVSNTIDELIIIIYVFE